MKLKNKTALVTGGSSGIGLATARLFVEEGAHVYISARRQHELDAAVAAIGGAVVGIPCDIAKMSDLENLYRRIGEERGSLDVLVQCAGAAETMLPGEVTAEHFDRVFGVNARGTYFTIQKALPLFADGGSIVLVGSAVHMAGVPAYSVYSASKAAIRSFARSWAASLAPRGIRVNALSPGPIDTPLMDAQGRDREENAAIRAMLLSTVPLGRLGTAEEVARAALFLASDDSNFTTGIDLIADGGQTQI